MKTAKQLLATAAGLSFAVALFQLVVTFSIPWSLYFGAPPSVVSKPLVLYASGTIVAIIFFIFGLYALSGAHMIRRVPLLRTGLVTIMALYTIRGLLLVPEVLTYIYNPRGAAIFPKPALWSSAVSLIIGIIYLVGMITGWGELPTKRQSALPKA
ncbi:MAG TPA: hypothetical protein VLX91_05495 [Candidatus Acidoferrales bacterium]|nr:hypothetical protein [Candidatus Acidoferrales bacterium]